MTKFRWKPEQTTRDRIDQRNVWQGKRDLDREEAARRRDGIRHHNNPDDPWAEDLRPCEPGCQQHRSEP